MIHIQLFVSLFIAAYRYAKNIVRAQAQILNLHVLA